MIIIDPYAINDIHFQIDKIIKGLGNPDPPLNLNEVRELLKLDRQYYSSSDDGILNEIVNKIKVGSRQLKRRPSLLYDVIKKLELKALWLPDRKRILIDDTIPDLKKRHVEAHEIIHSITPHHAPFFLGDDIITLQNSCYEKLEAEANYGSGQLLFLRNKFIEIAKCYPKNISSIKKLSIIFNNTMTMTLWRLIESSIDVPMFGTIGPHPLYACKDDNPFRYVITSSVFRERFSNINPQTILRAILSYIKPLKTGPIGEGEVSLYDLDDQSHSFYMETFHNTYEALTIGSYIGSSRKKIFTY